MPINKFLIRNRLINFDETDPTLGTDPGVTTPTIQPQPDPAVPQYLAVLNQANNARREVEEENARLRAELVASRAPVATTPTLEPGEAFNNPNKFLQSIESLVQRQIAPLQAEVLESRRVRAYSEQKARLRQFYPQFAELFTRIEPFVDQIMSGQEPTEANLTRAIETATGRLAINAPQLLYGQTQVQQNNQAPPQNIPTQNPSVNTVLPPHLRPNNSAPTPTNRPAQVEYDENERRLIRESGMPVEDWETLKNCPPDKLEATYRQILEKRKQGAK